VINVATGGRISLNHLFNTVRDLVGAKVEPIYAAPRAGDVKDSQADISKAASCSATRRSCRSRTASSRPWSGTARR
jgi:nucleoside-diphosphate-sugar epimerase